MNNIEVLIVSYTENNMRKLKQICYPMIIKIGGITELDYDDFYSIANETLWKAATVYNEKENDSFDAFLRGCIERKFKTEMTRRNRDRRIPSSQIDRLDRPMRDGERESRTFGESLPSKHDIESEIDELSKNINLINYINSLSKKQKEIAKLVIDGYELHAIKEALGYTDERFALLLEGMRTFEKHLILNGRA